MVETVNRDFNFGGETIHASRYVDGLPDGVWVDTPVNEAVRIEADRIMDGQEFIGEGDDAMSREQVIHTLANWGYGIYADAGLFDGPEGTI